MVNTQIHGYTTRDEWDKAFQIYFDKIKELDQQNHELLMTRRDREGWIKDFKKQSATIRNAYLQNSQFKQQHIFYFTKHPENWTPEVADSLLSYLYRYWFLVDDVECAFACASSLHTYYEEKKDEISVMKCKMVLLSSYHFLDEIHFADICLSLCKEIQDILLRHYDELSEEDVSMALSVYDFQNNIRYDNLRLSKNFARFFDEVLYPEYQDTYNMLTKFMEKADMSLPINASLPRILLNSERMFVSSVSLIHKDTLRDDQVSLLRDKALELWERQDDNLYGRVEDCIGYRMANRFFSNISNEDLIQSIIQSFQEIPDLYKDKSQVSDVIAAAQSFDRMLHTLLEEDASRSDDYRGILENYVNYLLSLPYGKVMTYIVDQTVYRSIIPLLQYLHSEHEIFTVLLDLTIFRQIQTAVHSHMVGKIASLILKYVIAQKPEILKDIPGLETNEKVEEKKEEIQQFIIRASLVHDVGKILCTNEINMQYRRISDVEFETIRFHPTSSSEILKSIPQLRKFHDIATGHHKSFDGTFGYPAWFDNTASKQKVFIDLIRICDSLDAATDTFGRLYAEPKSFQVVLKELEMLKGTSYSDVLVDFIVSEKELQKELADLMERGREDVYRDIYNMIQKKQMIH